MTRQRMRNRLTLRGRLNLTIGVTMLLILLGGSLISLHGAHEAVKDEALSTVRLALQLVEAGLPEQTRETSQISAWMNRLGKLDKIRHLRIRVIGPYSSTVNLSAPSSRTVHQVPRWFRWAVSPDPIQVSHQLQDKDGLTYTILIEANADDEILEVWSETRGFLILLLTLGIAVYLLVNVIVGQAFRSVDTILDGLEHIEKGVFDKRLPDFPLPEFNRIAGAFNHMASKLERTRKENRELVHKSLQIQEEERRHLARELHDELGQSLTAIKVMAASLRKGQDEATDNPANQIIRICDQLFQVIRSMMRRLRPSLLDELGLIASLEDLVGNWKTNHPELTIELRCDEAIDEAYPEANIDLFRIIQECLTNVVKHARAHRVLIDLKLTEDMDGEYLSLTIHDDGTGFDDLGPPTGFGLRSIRERVEGLDGDLSIITQPGQGVSVDIKIPMNSRNE